MNIPLSKVHMDEETKKAVIEVLESGWYILGERTRQFETKFAEFIGSKYAIAVSSGTAAIFLSLLAHEIGPNDEVIIPSHSFVATATPIMHLNAKPVFVDIDINTYNIDPTKIQDKITSKTRAIMPVHLYGHMANMDPIMDLAEDHDLIIIEDACQAHGGEYKNKKAGSIGHISSFSFYPSKNMTVGGDGGIITTDNEEIALRIRALRNHGRKEKYLHDSLGYNFRFNEIQAAIGLRQLELLPKWIKSRRSIASLYNSNISKSFCKPIEQVWAKHVYYMYVIRVKNRSLLQQYLTENGISTGIHFPVAIHKQPVIEHFYGIQEKLKSTEIAESEVLSLPMFPTLTQNEIKYICNTLNDYPY
jgi:perosamine synthetase